MAGWHGWLGSPDELLQHAVGSWRMVAPCKRALESSRGLRGGLHRSTGAPLHLLSMWHATLYPAVKQQVLLPPSPVQPSSPRAFSSGSGGRPSGGRPDGGSVRPVQSRVALEVESAAASSPCPSEQGSGMEKCSGQMAVQQAVQDEPQRLCKSKPAVPPGMIPRLIMRGAKAWPTACSGWTCLRTAPGCGAASTTA